MRESLTGTVHGRSIELDQEPQLPDGQQVTVTIEAATSAQARTTTAPSSEAAREALRRAAGTWADENEALDEYLAWSRDQRKAERPELSP